MTNEKIKEVLKKIYECKEDFSVTQTGKKSNKVNGFYTDKHEIFLHDKNFATENEMMFTAIHEFTHHIITTEKKVKSYRSHNSLFWATFYDFIDKAEELGLYSRNRADETKKIIKKVRDIQQQLIATQKKLGLVIAQLYETCSENGDRIEDVIEHDCQITRKKAKEYMQMAQKKNDISDEMSKAVDSANENQKNAVMKAIEQGKTLEQVKSIAKASPAVDNLDPSSKLIKEKYRLEKTIGILNDRLTQIKETLINMGKDNE